MPSIQYGSVVCERNGDESVLDALLRSGIAVAHSCKAGVCGSCLMRATPASAIPAKAQAGLKDAWRANGYFLACVCHPEQDLIAGPVGDEARVAVSIASLHQLSASVLRVRLVSESPFEYRPGQYITLFRDDGLARSYSIASLPAEGVLELHVRLLPNGRMGQWLASGAAIGAEMHIQGPSGECFYLDGREDQPLLLAGTGTGLAPLYGIARDALRLSHRAPVHLFHGAATAEGLYLEEELRGLAATHENFHYTPTVLATDGPIDRAILNQFPKLNGWRAFLCGDPSIVQSLKRKLFLAGAALNDIHADAFLPSV
jgi:CDP-4-dehydro-6-deoxyglucose reductase